MFSFGTHYTQDEPINDVDNLLFSTQSKIREAAKIVEYEEDDPVPCVTRIIECVKIKAKLTDQHICSLLNLTPQQLRDVVIGEKGLDVTKLNILKAFISLSADLSDATDDDLKRILPIARLVDNSKTSAGR